MIIEHEELKVYRLHERFGFQLSRLSKLVQSNLEASLAQHALSRMQWYVLSGVEIEKHCSPSELAEYMGVSRPAISRMLKNMEKDNLIERKLMDTDGRTRLLSVTDTGRTKLSLCWKHIQETDRHFLRKLSNDEIVILGDLIQTLADGEKMELDQL